jgi:hypothetical protein
MVGDAASDAVTELAATPFGVELVGVLFFVLLGLLGIALCWAMVLGAARWARERLGYVPETRARRPAFSRGSDGMVPAPAKGERAEPLLGGDSESRGQLRPERAPPPDIVEKKPFPAARRPAGSEQALPIRHVRMAELPRLVPAEATPRGRSEGAGEVARVSIRHELPGKHRSPVCMVDYLISALPQVDSAGRKRPDMLIYTISEPKAAPKRSLSPFRFKG